MRTIDLAVHDEGDGPPVVLLHGFPDSAAMWRHVTPTLVASGRRVLAPDLRGFGRSPAPEQRSAYGIDLAVQDVIAMLDARGLHEPVDVVGHDWGALLGWALCLQHPERVRRHVAISVGHPVCYARAGLEQKRKGVYVLQWQVPRVAEAWLSARGFRRMRAKLTPHPDLEAVVADLARPGRLTAGLNWYRANVLAIFTRRWGRCAVPTLAIWGADDRYLAEDQITRSEKRMDAEWRYERLAGAGHWLPLERPDEVAGLILAWSNCHDAAAVSA